MPICIKPVYNIKLFLPHIIAHVTTMSQVERNILVSILLFTYSTSVENMSTAL